MITDMTNTTTHWSVVFTFTLKHYLVAISQNLGNTFDAMSNSMLIIQLSSLVGRVASTIRFTIDVTRGDAQAFA